MTDFNTLLAKANLDQSLYNRNKSKATKELSALLTERYLKVEHLDRDGSYGSCTTLRAKMAWLEARGALHPMKTVRNLMSGKEIEIPADTPLCCDPSSETYWSM